MSAQKFWYLRVENELLYRKWNQKITPVVLELTLAGLARNEYRKGFFGADFHQSLFSVLHSKESSKRKGAYQ